VSCVFCAIVEGRAPAWQVYEDDDCQAFLDINPATPGHTLVVPKHHATDLLDLDEGGAQLVMRATHRVARLLDERLSPAGLNVVQATRAAAWQTVFHMHMHVIPRYDDDGLTPPWRVAPADAGQLADISRRLTG